jgi:hypothetical protein
MNEPADDRSYLEPDSALVSWAPSPITLRDMRVEPGDVVRFLAHLATEGNIGKACRFSGVSRSTIQRMRADVPEFGSAFASAMENAGDVVDAEIYRRAVKGVVRPIYQGGKQVGEVREYSDRLLELRAKAIDPRYKDVGKSSIQVNAQAAAMGAPTGPPVPALGRADDMPDHELTLGEGIQKLLEVAQSNQIMPEAFRVERADDPPDPSTVPEDDDNEPPRVNGVG